MICIPAHNEQNNIHAEVSSWLQELYPTDGPFVFRWTVQDTEPPLAPGYAVTLQWGNARGGESLMVRRTNAPVTYTKLGHLASQMVAAARQSRG